MPSSNSASNYKILNLQFSMPAFYGAALGHWLRISNSISYLLSRQAVGLLALTVLWPASGWSQPTTNQSTWVRSESASALAPKTLPASVDLRPHFEKWGLTNR